MATIIGDVLLSSAYLAYAGYFDQHVSSPMTNITVMINLVETQGSSKPTYEVSCGWENIFLEVIL